MFYEIYNTILFQPLLNLMVWCYNLVGDIGVAIIIVTILVRLVLVPLSVKATKSQRALQQLQPEMNKLRQQHKDNKEEQTKALMEFYKKNKINPASSCLPMLVQLPIIFALYRVFRVGMNAESMDKLYSFVSQPETVNHFFINLVDMTEPNLILAVLAGIFQFLQSRMMMPKGANKKKSAKGQGIAADMSSMMTKQMTYFLPVMTVFIAMSLPSGLALYWATTTLFALGQQYLIIKWWKPENKEEKGAGGKKSATPAK
ncbi:YidC/Oxa1 family membrane protein insertase [Patescibacteria group bacterium]|nr:YidC/Oxa1 family membrane protein insertase [Patescibacteria group bacterium]